MVNVLQIGHSNTISRLRVRTTIHRTRLLFVAVTSFFNATQVDHCVQDRVFFFFVLYLVSANLLKSLLFSRSSPHFCSLFPPHRPVKRPNLDVASFSFPSFVCVYIYTSITITTGSKRIRLGYPCVQACRHLWGAAAGIGCFK